MQNAESMDRTELRGTSSRDLVWDSCGRRPHPRRGRLTLAKLAAVFPIGLLMHAIASRQDLPIIATAALLAIITTILVIWAVEPSALRLLRSWLRAPAPGTQRRSNEAAVVWRLRATFDDKPGALEKLAGQLAPLGAEIVSLKEHRHARGIRNELVLSAPEHVQASEIAEIAAIRNRPGLSEAAFQPGTGPRSSHS